MNRLKIAVLALFLFGGFLGVSAVNAPKAAAAAPKCYSQTTDGPIELFPVCNRDIETLGFVMGDLPNPLAEDRCYFWSNDQAAPGQDVTDVCGQPPYSDAAQYGSTVPPPPSLENIGTSAQTASTSATASSDIKVSKDVGNFDFRCGGSKEEGFDSVNLSFDIGCRHKGNPIIDMLFAVIRILTTGVGFALIISIIIAGVQYTTAGGDPNKTSLAKQRLVSTLLVALPLYLLTYAILNWLVPGMVL